MERRITAYQPHGSEEVERLILSSQAQADVGAYLDYNAIVGNADGGRMFTQAEFQEFKEKAIIARRNRLYVNFRNSDGVDCKVVGPQTKCFCGHRYKLHATDNVSDRQVYCRENGCSCTLFEYVPGHGSWSAKCRCRHDPEEHSADKPHLCRSGCACTGFSSTWRCSCGRDWNSHQTVYETRAERMAGGRSVDNLAGGGDGYEALGGVTNYSSLLDGVERAGIAFRVTQPQLTSPSALVGETDQKCKEKFASDSFSAQPAKRIEVESDRTPYDLLHAPHRYAQPVSGRTQPASRPASISKSATSPLPVATTRRVSVPAAAVVAKLRVASGRPR